MNPFDSVGTTRLSTSISDRMCRLAVGYQDAVAERDIVARRAAIPHREVSEELGDQVRADAVALTRATRDTPDIRQGSSVRGAIDLTLVAGELLALRAITDAGTGRVDLSDDASPRTRYACTLFDAMTVALSGRIHLDETVDATPEEVLRQLWVQHFLLEEAVAGPG